MKLHFVHSIRGLQNFLAIPIMNTLAGFMIYIYIYIYHRCRKIFFIIGGH